MVGRTYLEKGRLVVVLAKWRHVTTPKGVKGRAGMYLSSVKTEAAWCVRFGALRTARSFAFRADLLDERRRDEIR